MSLRIAFVVQRYGLEVTGGAEQHCRAIAERLAGEYEVSVLTTCALDHSTWENFYPPGETAVNGVRVLRFPVARSRAPDFNAFVASFYGRPHSRPEELDWLERQGPTCPALLHYLEGHRQDYDVFVFYTYLYSPTVLGLPLVADRAVLVPTAHDEPPLYLGLFRELFLLPRHFLFLTSTEERLVRRLFDNSHIPSSVVGTGVDGPGVGPAPERFRRKYGLGGDFLLYMGRVEGGKGCGELVDFFCRFQGRSGWELSLVFLGRADMPLPQRPDLRALGFLPEEDKWDALAAATLLVAPSPYESLGMAVLEAWSQGLPVLANGRCAVLEEHCLASNGGLFYTDYAEFEACLGLLLRTPQLRAALGRRGQQYVRDSYTWDAVLDRWEESIARVAGGAGGSG